MTDGRINTWHSVVYRNSQLCPGKIRPVCEEGTSFAKVLTTRCHFLRTLLEPEFRRRRHVSVGLKICRDSEAFLSETDGIHFHPWHLDSCHVLARNFANYRSPAPRSSNASPPASFLVIANLFRMWEAMLSIVNNLREVLASVRLSSSTVVGCVLKHTWRIRDKWKIIWIARIIH